MVEPSNESIRVPLSLLQGQMWHFETTSPTPGFYNEAIRHRLSRPVDTGMLREALGATVARHEALRTRFPADAGGPYQSIVASLTPELEVADLRAVAAADRENALARLAQTEQRMPFDLEAGPPFRFRLFRLTDDISELMICLDHMIADDTSMSLLLGDVLAHHDALAAGRPADLPALGVQYADFAVWQRKWFTPEREQAQRSYWRAKLAGVPETRAVPYGTEGPPDSVDLRVPPQVHCLLLDRGLRARLAALARATATSLSVVCTAAVESLIALSTGDTDTVVLTTFGGRFRPEVERVVGLFGGFGFIRTDLSGDPPVEVVLRRARASVLGLMENHHLPVLDVIDEVRASGTHLGMPSVPVGVHFFHASHDRWIPGTSVIARPPDRPGPKGESTEAGKPLDIRFFDDGEMLWAMVHHHSELFEPGAVVRFASDLERVLEAMAGDPLLRLSELPVAPLPATG